MSSSVTSSLTRIEPLSAHSRLALASGHPARVSCYASTSPAMTPPPDSPLGSLNRPHQPVAPRKRSVRVAERRNRRQPRGNESPARTRITTRTTRTLSANENPTGRVFGSRAPTTSRRSRAWCGRSCWCADPGGVGARSLSRGTNDTVSGGGGCRRSRFSKRARGGDPRPSGARERS